MTTVAAVAFSVLAVALLVHPRPRPFVASPPGRSEKSRDPGRSRRVARRLGVGALAVAAVVLAAVLGGSAPAVVAVAVVLVVATGARLAVEHRRTVAAQRARTEVATASRVLASQLRVGRIPADALASAAGDCAVLGEASAAQSLGGDVVAVWLRQAARPGHAGLADLARAWRVSTDTGASLVGALDRVAEELHADQGIRTVVAAELAAPRATGKIMAALPFCGLGLGYLIGGRPIAFLLGGPYGWGCLLGGVSLACLGVLWIDRLAGRAAEQG